MACFLRSSNWRNRWLWLSIFLLATRSFEVSGPPTRKRSHSGRGRKKYIPPFSRSFSENCQPVSIHDGHLTCDTIFTAVTLTSSSPKMFGVVPWVFLFGLACSPPWRLMLPRTSRRCLLSCPLCDLCPNFLKVFYSPCVGTIFVTPCSSVFPAAFVCQSPQSRQLALFQQFGSVQPAQIHSSSAVRHTVLDSCGRRVHPFCHLLLRVQCCNVS